MKVLSSKDKLNGAINIVSRAASKSLIVSQDGIKLDAYDNSLVLSGSNLEIEIIVTLECEVEEEGKAVLNSRMLGDIVKKSSGKEISIEILDNYLTKIKSGSSKFEITGFSPDESSKFLDFNAQHFIKISKNKLRQMITNTVFSVSSDANKPVLTGCFFEIKKNFIKMVAIDGFRMAIRVAQLDEDYESNCFIVPCKVLLELSRILKDENEYVNVSYSDSRVAFSFDNCTVISRLIEGKYIDYERIIPKGKTTVFNFNTFKLLKIIERVAIVITSDSNRSPIKFLFKNDSLNISCKTSCGFSEDSIEIEPKDFELEIGFNHRFLIDALKACETEEVCLSFDSSITPLTITPIYGDSFCYIVLPVRLKTV
ncbi:MAG: DNA polymerase III subunit beta [Clostridiales bacterium]|jgi:DNA polymerase-3 subunit beta|nr:DNA polymerase III subunit beta [Clostridiales bacterium]